MDRAPNGNTYYWCRKYWGDTCYAIKYQNKKYLVVKYSLVKGRLRQTIVETCPTVCKAEKLVINADVGNPKDKHIENTPQCLFATLSYIKENKQLNGLVGAMRGHKKFVRDQRKYRKENPEFPISVIFENEGYTVHIRYDTECDLFSVVKGIRNEKTGVYETANLIRTYRTFKGATNYLAKNYVPKKKTPNVVVLPGPERFVKQWWSRAIR